jgi:type IV secretion system protein VirB9
MMKKSLILLSVGVSSALFAAQSPIKLSSDSRLEVVTYSESNVVPIHGTTLTSTQIAFSPEEYIKNVQNGDLGAWTASIDKNLPYMMFVKPTAYHSNTNMTVVTNKHTYFFELISNEAGQEDQSKATYSVKFIYPGDSLSEVEEEILSQEQLKETEISAFAHPADYHWNYSFHGDKSIVPLHVFDDGKFTYFELQPGQAFPAVFAVKDRSGKESVVNYRKDGNYLIVQEVDPQFTLRTGEAVASIFNNDLIKARGN